jgi:hypothetical protein
MPLLIIVCGLIGSGKSTVAKEISRRLQIDVISSDVVRKKLAGIPLTARKYEEFEKGLYSPDFTRKTYLRMFEMAEERIKKGNSVILDATFSKKWQRAEAKKVSEEARGNFLCIEVTCPEEVIVKRLENRMRRGSGVSDGRLEIFPEHKADFEVIDEFSKDEHLIVDTSRDLQQEIERVTGYLLKHYQ